MLERSYLQIERTQTPPTNEMYEINMHFFQFTIVKFCVQNMLVILSFCKSRDKILITTFELINTSFPGGLERTITIGNRKYGCGIYRTAPPPFKIASRL